MKKSKKIALLLAILMLAVTVLSGCSSNTAATPTEAPTEAATEVATEAPTEEPTEAPTEEPTEVPTEEPTEAPTEEPTEAPTEEPTEAPTEEPTEAPTEEPTEAPTEEPTEAPTEEPTEAPTEEPTEAPTEEVVAEAAEEKDAAEATEEVAAEVTEEPDQVYAAEATEEAAAEATEEVAAEATEEPDQVLAYINGAPVMQSTVDDVVDYYYQNYYYYGFTEDYFKPIALNYGLTDTLVTSKMDEENFQLTDEQLAAAKAEGEAYWEEEVDYYVSYYGSYYFGLTDESTDEDRASVRAYIISMLESYGTTEDYIVSVYETNARYNAYVAAKTPDVTVTEDEVKASFEEQLASDKESYAGEDGVASYEYAVLYSGGTSYYTPEGYRTMVNLVLSVDDDLLNNYLTLKENFEAQEEAAAATATDLATATDAEATAEPDAEATAEPTAEPVTAEQVEAARQAVLASVQSSVEDINTRVAAGEDFAAIAAEYAEKGAAAEGGTTYNVNVNSIMYDSAFVTAAFSVENVGDITEPAVGEYGVYVLKYDADVPSGAVELTDEIYNDIYESLLSDAQSTAFNTLVSGWLEEATIEYTDLGVTYRDANETTDDDTASTEEAEVTEEPAAEATETTTAQ